MKKHSVDGASPASKVLVVDDCRELAENIAEILELTGFVAGIYANAEEVLSIPLRDDVAAVIADYRLPGINGAELIRLIRERRHGVRAVVISCNRDDQIVAAARSVGAAFVSKPLDVSRLGQIVRDLDSSD